MAGKIDVYKRQGMDEFQHFSRKEPALAHLVAVAQIALDIVVQFVEITRRPETSGAVECVDHSALILFDVASEYLTELLLDPLAAVEVHIHVPVVDLENDEVGEAGHHGLSAVSYTHLDVYKRQGLGDPGSPGYSGGRPAAGKRKTVKKERRKGKAS